MTSEKAGASWPPPNGLTTVNVPRSDTVLSVYASTRINAPAKRVFEVVRDIRSYQSWNQFCPKTSTQVQPLTGDQPPFDKDGGVDFGTLYLGTVFTFDVIMNAKKPNSSTPTQLKVTDISTPENPSTYISQETLDGDPGYFPDLTRLYRISWKPEGGFVNKGLRGERFHEIFVLGDNQCEVRTWENQSGVLAHTVKWLYKQTLMEKFQLWVDDLKKRCEQV
jgi:hypothetical protein